MNLRETRAKRSELSPVSLLRMVWKHKGVVLGIWVVVTVAVVAVVTTLPAIFRAEASILVEGQRIPQNYVAATVTDDLKVRLNTISQEVLSYSKLLDLINRFDLYREQRANLPDEVIIERMRQDIGTQLSERWSRDRPGAFLISYEGPDPQVVAQVANELANLFIAGNLRARELQAVGTSEFLEGQLADAKASLEEQEARLSKYKTTFMGELPQQQGALLGTAGRLQGRLTAIKDAVDQSEEKKLLLENALESAKASYATMTHLTEQPQGSSTNPNPGVAVVQPPHEDLVKKLTATLQQLRLQYTDEHPDVRKARSDLARALELQKQALASAPENLPAVGGSSGGPVAAMPQGPVAVDSAFSQTLTATKERIADLNAQIALLETRLEELNRDRQETLTGLSSLQERIEKIPVREQEMTGVTRDYEISKEYYTSLLNKKLAADLAMEMERRQKAERFVLLDAARVPVNPVKPNRTLWSGIGSLAGLCFGLALPLLIEFKKNAILGEWELPREIPVLGRVPFIDARATKGKGRNQSGGTQRVRLKKWAIASSIVLCLIAAIVASRFYLGWS